MQMRPITANPSQIMVEQLAASDLVEEDDEGSSIFAPFLTGASAKQKAAALPRDDIEDELTLVPDEELDSRDTRSRPRDDRPAPSAHGEPALSSGFERRVASRAAAGAASGRSRLVADRRHP